MDDQYFDELLSIAGDDIQASSPSKAINWEFLREKSKVRIYRNNKNEEMNCSKGVGIIETSPQVLFSTLSDIKNLHLWTGMVDDAELLETIDDHTFIIYLSSKGKLNAAPRDFIIVVSTRQYEDGTCVILARSIDSNVEKYQRKSQQKTVGDAVIRGEIQTSGFVIRPVRITGLAPSPASHATFVIQYNGKGWLPPALINKISSYLPMRIARIREIIPKDLLLQQQQFQQKSPQCSSRNYHGNVSPHNNNYSCSTKYKISPRKGSGSHLSMMTSSREDIENSNFYYSSSFSSSEEEIPHGNHSLFHPFAPSCAPITPSSSTSSLCVEGDSREDSDVIEETDTEEILLSSSDERSKPSENTVDSIDFSCETSLKTMKEHLATIETMVSNVELQAQKIESSMNFPNHKSNNSAAVGLTIETEQTLAQHIYRMKELQTTELQKQSLKEEEWQKRIDHLSFQLSNFEQSSSSSSFNTVSSSVRVLFDDLFGFSMTTTEDHHSNQKKSLFVGMVLFLWSLLSFHLWNAFKSWCQLSIKPLFMDNESSPLASISAFPKTFHFMLQWWARCFNSLKNQKWRWSSVLFVFLLPILRFILPVRFFSNLARGKRSFSLSRILTFTESVDSSSIDRGH